MEFISSHYKQQSKKVYAVLNCDMIGYNKNNSQIAIYNGTVVSPSLTEFLIKVVKEYASIPYLMGRQPGSSDYYSWTRAGYHR